MCDMILSPSPNWFQHNAVSSRAEDRLLVTACFRNIVVYKVNEEKSPPRVLKLIPSFPGKVSGLSLYPNHAHPELGHTVAVIIEQGVVSLVDLHMEVFLSQHQVQKCTTLNSVCWGFVKGDDIVVAVGDKGNVVVWCPKYQVAKSFILETKKNLSVVEVVPHATDEAIVASDKTILHISLQTGEIITQLKGHDNPIYCIRFYFGYENPRDIDKLTLNTRWKRDEDEDQSKDSSSSAKDSREEENPTGPFFASSDVGRTILFWDMSVKRYLTSCSAPVSYGAARKQGKDRSQGKNHHITLNWADGRLYSNTVMGEIIQWNLSVSDPKCKLVTHSHSRAIYNMEVISSLLITFSQDRTIQAYDLNSSSSFFNVPTLGVCPNSMVFSPHDAHRLAIGMQEAIELITFSDDSPLKMQSLRQNIKGKVLSLSWHPAQEGKLLFSTSDGQVGVADVFSSKISSFAHFHQKAAYKVEWAPPVAPQKTGLNELWYAYSFGDRELLCYSASDAMKKPLHLDELLGLKKVSSSSFCLSEFAFSPDYVFLALGFLNGQINIYDGMTLHCLIKISRVRKVIQHLLWKPPTSSDFPYILGVASGENSVFVFNLDDKLEESKKSPEPLSIFQPTRELSSHTGRVVWLSWSPHSDGILATSSYDHTVQVWNVNSGEPLGNYSGHSHRVFRAEFSPTDPDKILSFAEENCVHVWRPSQLTSRTPSESTASLREYRKKAKAGFLVEKEQTPKEGKGDNSESETVNSTSVNPNFDSSTVSVTKKNATKKSSFPLLHNVSARKRTFHHMCILSLLEAVEADKKESPQRKENEENLSEDLEEECHSNHLNGDVSGTPVPSSEGIETHVANALKRYGHFIPPDNPLPEVDDISFYLNFFGSLPEMDGMVNKEIKHHEKNGNISRANLMRCWQGSLESHIKWAARHKQLDAFLVSAAPQVSFSLWEFACEAYAEQLVEADDPVTAATYLISIHKDEEAVSHLIQSKNYREALCIAKYRMGFNKEAVDKVVDAWYRSLIFDGNFELASILQLKLGNRENAARSLARRTEAGSLVVAAQLFLSADCFELAKSTAILAFKEASCRREFYKFEPILKSLPELHWCSCINICHQSILEYLTSYKLADDQNLSTRNGNSTLNHLEENVCLPHVSDFKYLLETVINRWKEHGVLSSNYFEYLKNIKENVVEKTLPTSLKHLWFLISIWLSEMILSALSEEKSEPHWEKCLESALECVEYWGKTDQIYYLTHLLLPKGILDLSTLQAPLKEEENSTTLNHLRELYISSTTDIILLLLKDDSLYIPWKENKTTQTTLNGQNGHVCTQAEEVPRASVDIIDVEKEDLVQLKLTNSAETVHVGKRLECATDGGLSDRNDTKSETYFNAKNYKNYLFECKDDFLNAFDTYLNYLTRSSYNNKNLVERIKVLSNIISCLRERAVFVPLNLVSKFSEIEQYC